MKRFIAAASIAGSVVAFGAAQASPDYAEWDTNKDGKISYQEWEAGNDKMDVYASWDTDGDGVLSRSEYNRGSWKGYDANQDDHMDDKEFGMFRSETEYKFPGNTGTRKGK